MLNQDVHSVTPGGNNMRGYRQKNVANESSGEEAFKSQRGGENGQAHKSSQHCRSELQVWIVSAWLELTELRLREGGARYFGNFREPAAYDQLQASSTRDRVPAVCVSVNVLMATLLLLSDSLLVLTGPADRRGINTKTQGHKFFSHYCCVSLHALSTKRVAYVRIDFIMTDSLMIPHKQYEDI